MAKSKSFFGLRRGSTRDHTFYIQDGKQITRSRVEHVKNPRSLAQMQQRMIMSTAIAAYKGMKDICDHSWEGVEYGAKSFQKFMSVNTRLLREDLATDDNFLMANYQQKKFFLGAYQLSDGTFNGPDSNIIELDDSYERYTVQLTVNFGEIIPHFNAYNNQQIMDFLGINEGDTITLVNILTDKNLCCHFHWARLTFLLYDDITWTSDNYTEYIKIETDKDSKIEIQDGEDYFFWINTVEFNLELYNYWGGFIISSKVNDEWKRSPCRLHNFANNGEFPSSAEALSTYPIAHDFILNGQ